MDYFLNRSSNLPEETLAWVTVRAAVHPFLSNCEILAYLSALHHGPCLADSSREKALDGFARSLADARSSVSLAVEKWFAGQFDEDECYALVAFAGTVRRYPHICGLTIAK
jgi:hypothetical protein